MRELERELPALFSISAAATATETNRLTGGGSCHGNHSYPNRVWRARRERPRERDRQREKERKD